MRYVAIIGPRAGRARRSGLTRLASKAWLQLPKQGRVMERFGIESKGDRCRLRMTIGGIGHLMQDREAGLWLPNAAFGPGGVPPSAFTLVREKSGNFLTFRLARAGRAGTPRELIRGFAAGAYFKLVRDQGSEEAGDILYVEPPLREGEELAGSWGVLNPGLAALRVGGRAASRLAGAVEGDELVDLHIDLPSEEWLRARLHLRLFKGWRERSGERPPVPALLFGGASPRSLPQCSVARAFFVLDWLGGEFTFRREPAPARWEWTAPREGLLDDPLVAKACEALELNGKEPAAAEGRGMVRVPDDAGVGPEEAGDPPVDFEELDVEELNRHDLPPSLAWLLVDSDRKPIRVTREEKEVIGKLGSAAAEDSFAQALVRAHLTPCSHIRAAPPAPPNWLTDPDRRKKWDGVDLLDVWRPKWATKRRNGGWTGQLADWWPRLVDPQVAAPSKPDRTRNATMRLADSKRLRHRNKWRAWDFRWKRDFVASLFHEAQDFEPDWEDRPWLPFILGKARLGRDAGLGGASKEEFPPTQPEEDERHWPRIIEV